MGRPTDQIWAANLVVANQQLSQDDLVRLVAKRIIDGQAEPGLIVPTDPPAGWSDPWLIGLVHEQAASFDERRKRGAWYTPAAVVRGLTRQAFDICSSSLPARVLDPTCGGGAFLLACLDQLVERGVEPVEALSRVRGSDIDAGAVRASQRSLTTWAALHGIGSFDATANVVELDALERCAFSDPPELIIGNPPFASPLRAGAISPSAEAYRVANSDALGPYADLASMHLHRAISQCQSGAVVSLVLPQSTLSSRDVGALRQHIESVAALRAAWATTEFVFDAGVRVWAPAFEVGATQGLVTVLTSASPVVIGERPYSDWGPIAADAVGAPAVTVPSASGVLGDIATATAGFRDEYYGLAAACTEAGAAEPEVRLVTVGAIDPLWCSWGEKPIKFASNQWSRPAIQRGQIEGKVGRWLDDQLVPKVLLATQTKVLEPFVDRSGTAAPSTPLIAVHSAPEQLDRVAAVLLAPPVVAWLYRRCFGAALSGDAIKVSARQLLEIPLPADTELWEEAAAIVGADTDMSIAAVTTRVVAVGRLMNEAYGAEPNVLDWWLDRLGVPAG